MQSLDTKMFSSSSTIIGKEQVSHPFMQKDVFCETWMPRRQQCPYGNSLNVHPKGQMMLVKCEKPLGEVTVIVWSLYGNLHVRIRTIKWPTDRQTDERCKHYMFQLDLSGHGYKYILIVELYTLIQIMYCSFVFVYF